MKFGYGGRGARRGATFRSIEDLVPIGYLRSSDRAICEYSLFTSDSVSYMYFAHFMLLAARSEISSPNASRHFTSVSGQ
jgi:hypothetical protein